MLLAGDIKTISNNSILKDFQKVIKNEFESWHKWFKANGLSLNFNKIISYSLQLGKVLKLIWTVFILTK